MGRRRKILQVTFSFLPSLRKYLERDTEIEKDQLLSRIAGEVDYPIFQTIKQIEFFYIGCDERENVYLL